jgi:hypothetical protein
MKNFKNAEMVKNRLELALAINHPSTKVNIDRTVFQKSPEEKEELKSEKRAWKKLSNKRIL